MAQSESIGKQTLRQYGLEAVLAEVKRLWNELQQEQELQRTQQRSSSAQHDSIGGR